MSTNRKPVSWSHVHRYTDVYKYVIQLNATRSITVVYPNDEISIYLLSIFFCTCIHFTSPGADPGEVKWVNFHLVFLSPLLIPQKPQQGFGSNTLLQKFTPHFKILNPRLKSGIKCVRDSQWLV